MNNLLKAAERRRQTAEERTQFSRASAALQLIVGIDLGSALKEPQRTTTPLLSRVRRALRREHLRGIARHWSYDLNRHIALRQALEYLSAKAVQEKKAAVPSTAAFLD